MFLSFVVVVVVIVRGWWGVVAQGGGEGDDDTRTSPTVEREILGRNETCPLCRFGRKILNTIHRG